MLPSGKIGLGTPPALESKPFRLRTILTTTSTPACSLSAGRHPHRRCLACGCSLHFSLIPRVAGLYRLTKPRHARGDGQDNPAVLKTDATAGRATIRATCRAEAPAAALPQPIWDDNRKGMELAPTQPHDVERFALPDTAKLSRGEDGRNCLPRATYRGSTMPV